MYRRIAATWLLIIAAALLLAASCAVSARGLSRPPPVLLLGDGGCRSRAQGRLHEARENVGRSVRFLGQRTPVKKPPSPKPHGMATMVSPLPPPPPAIID